jgi:hypothetical protein
MERTGGILDRRGDKSNQVQIKEIVITCWNVQGLKSKTEMPEFRETIKHGVILGVAETWILEKYRADLDGYIYMCKVRRKKEYLGGTAIFYREIIYNRIHMIKS